jgi:WhiB family redox-sensing transcriptional regulator
MTTFIERLELDIAPWRESAACARVDPELFHPERGQGERIAYARAKAVCANCPVQRECLDDALEQDDRYGIWGGLLPHEREEIRRQRGMTRDARSNGARAMLANRELNDRLLPRYEALIASVGNAAELQRELGISADALNKRMERARRRRGGK